MYKSLFRLFSNCLLYEQIMHSIDKLGIWHRLPVFLGLFYLAIRRHLHQEYNLFNVGKTPVGVRFNPADFPFRTADGEFNDPFNEGAGSEGTFFGRNVLPVYQKDKVHNFSFKLQRKSCILPRLCLKQPKEVDSVHFFSPLPFLIFSEIFIIKF